MITPPSVRQRVGRRSVRWNRLRVTCAAAAAASVMLPAPHAAANDNWQTTIGSGSWSTPGNWTLGIPTNGADVFITHNDATNRVITYDYTGTNAFDSLTLDNTGAGTNTLNQSTNALSVTGFEYIGFNGRGVLNQSGGSETIGTLAIAFNAGSTGTVNLSGGSLSAASVSLGGAGHGTLNVTGGTLTVTNGITIQSGSSNSVITISGGTVTTGTFTTPDWGRLTFNSGTLNLTGGISANAGNLTVGNTIANNFGIATVNQRLSSVVSVGDLNVGYSNGSSIYNLSNTASLTVNGNEFIGNSDGFQGLGTFNQTGGTHLVQNGLYLAREGTNNAVFNLSGGSLQVNAGESIGKDGGQGTFNQTGGTNLCGTIFLPSDALDYTGAFGTYNHSGGSFYAQFIAVGNVGGQGVYFLSNSGSLNVNQIEYVGYSGAGAFNQFGGNNICGALVLGNALNSSGTYNQSGGVNTMTTLNLAKNGGVVATYNMSGGLLKPYDVEMGAGGSGPGFNVSGGTVLVGTGINIHSGLLTISDATVSAAFIRAPDWNSVTFNSGTLILTNGVSSNSGNLVIGNSGNATVNQGDVSFPCGVGVGGDLFLANAAGFVGNYSLSNFASLTVTGNEYIGHSGTGLFTQAGGANVSSNLFVGSFAGSTGTYTQNGGNVTVSATLALGSGSSGTGFYNLSAGTINASVEDFGGNGGKATFNQSGGVNSTSLLRLAATGGSNAQAVINLSGGTLSTTGGALLGGLGTATGGVAILNVSGGNFTAGTAAVQVYNTSNGTSVSGVDLSGGSISAASLILPDWSRLNFTGGTLNLGAAAGVSSNAGSLIVGSGTGAATLNQSGGAVFVPGQLIVGNAPSGTGIYNLSGGTLNSTTTQYLGEGSGAAGTFTQTGGTNNADIGGMRIGDGGVGTYNLTTGSINAKVEDIGVNGGTGILNQSGGVNTVGNMRVASYGGTNCIGTVNLTGGTLSITGGTLLGGLGNVTSGLAILNVSGGSFTVQNAIQVYNSSNGTNVSGINLSGGTITAGSLILPNWSRLIFTGGTLNLGAGGGVSSNTGTLNIGGGTQATALNVTAGSLFATAVVNNGSFNQSGGQSTFGAMSGTGSVSIGGSTASTAVSVASLQQSSVTINNAGSLIVAPGTARLTHSIGLLSISGNGTLDIANHDVVLNGTYTTVNTLIKQAAGTPGGAQGLNPWTGSGITSSLVKTDAATGHIKQAAVGYKDNADYIASGNSGKAVAPGKVLVSYAAYGDANLDNTVDIADLSIWNNNFATGNHWGQGDFNYDGTVDIADLSVWNNNFFNSVSPAKAAASTSTPRTFAAAPKTLSGSTAVGAPVAPATPAVNTLELDIDASTGDAVINSGGASIAAVEIDSAAKDLVTANWKSFKNFYHVSGWSFAKGVPNTAVVAEFTSDASSSGTPIALAQGSLTDYGQIVPVGFSNTGDLTFKYNIVLDAVGNTQSKIGTVVITGGVPEPASLGLATLAGGLLLSRRRRRG